MHEMYDLHAECEVITEFYTYDHRLITPSMTRFTNSLSGTVVVMGTTIADNNSQALYNYRRQRIIQGLIQEYADVLPFVREAARVFLIANKGNEEADFSNIFTLISLSSDTLCETKIHLPLCYKNFSKVTSLDENGEWREVSYESTPDGITLLEPLSYLEPTYLKLS